MMNDTHQSVVERLSDFIDGELDVQQHGEVERHLAGCAACRAVAAELREVAARAASLSATPPEQDLWSGIVTRLERRAGRVAAFQARPRRRFSFTLPQIAAASVALMMLSGGMVWLARSGDPRADFPVTLGSESAGDERAAMASLRLVDSQYEGAIEDLEAILERGRGRLDAETVRVLEQNLESIDAAIRQCRQALEKDPANAYLNIHLAEARQRKLALLRRATALTAGS